MKITVIPARAEYFDLLQVRDQERDAYAKDPAFLEKAQTLINISLCGAVMVEGVILAIIGYYELWPGVFEVWSMPSVYIKKYPTAYLKTVKQYVRQIIDTYQPHRLQSPAINDELHDRWMTFLGFTKCGVMRQWSADKVDYAMWEMLPDYKG